MRAFTPGHEPPALQRYRSTAAKYAELSKALKNSIRDSLREEQHGLCAYCGRRLGEDARVRIEHFHPQSIDAENKDCLAATGISEHADTSLRWANLLLCCTGDENGWPDNRHCDVSKKNTDICRCFPNPKTTPLSGLLVRAMPDGKVVATAKIGAGAQQVIDEVLRLNCAQLVKERKEQVMSRWRLFRQKAIEMRDKKRAREAVLAQYSRRPSADINDMLFIDWVKNGQPPQPSGPSVA